MTPTEVVLTVPDVVILERFPLWCITLRLVVVCASPTLDEAPAQKETSVLANVPAAKPSAPP